VKVGGERERETETDNDRRDRRNRTLKAKYNILLYEKSFFIFILFFPNRILK